MKKYLTIVNGQKHLKSFPTKTISFQFFVVNSDINKINIKFPYDGEISKISASTNAVGTLNTELAIEKISNSDFKNKLNNWSNILSSNIKIKQNELVDDESYSINNYYVFNEDRFRVSLIGNTDVITLNLEIEILLK